MTTTSTGHRSRIMLLAALSCLVCTAQLCPAQTTSALFIRPRCTGGTALQPLFTPITKLDVNALRVLVDFVVNKDGRVESPFVLSGSGEANEKLVLDIINEWRFRPATCNGVPTAVEVRVRFVGPRRRLPHPAVSGE